MYITRRNFINGLAAALGLTELFGMEAQAVDSGRQSQSKILVVIQLCGGNDGLNMVVPYAIGTYYDLRPTIAIKQEDVLPIDRQIGLHPSMDALADLFAQGKLAVIQAVGYPNPTRSHFRATEIWHTAQPDRISDKSWFSRCLALKGNGKQALNKDTAVINVDQILQPNDLEVGSTSDYLPQAGYKGTIRYPHGSLGKGLQLIAEMISGGINSSFYALSADGFDTHEDQCKKHAGLLRQLSQSLFSFQADLSLRGFDKDVLTLVFSEFGRCVAENGELGTDHGTAGPVLVLGKSVNGGIYGDATCIESYSRALKFNIDFRSIYATIIDNWLSSDSSQILGGRFEHLTFV